MRFIRFAAVGRTGRLLSLVAGLLALPAVVSAGSDAYPPETPPLIPDGAVRLADPSALAAEFEAGRPATLSMGGGSGFLQSEPGSKKKYLPVLLSALVPGAGEIYMGYWKRGAVLVAAEAAAWTGYVKFHEDGLDMREQYEAFADENWSQRKWIDDHPNVYPTFQGWSVEQLDSLGQVVSGSGSWPGYNPWVSKEEDKQHFYENIGKYDWYISGWTDYDPDTQPHDTPLRDEYRSMRRESNDDLDTANRFIFLSLAARVFSLVETTLLVRSQEDDGVGMSQRRLRVTASPKGLRGGEVALVYSFK